MDTNTRKLELKILALKDGFASRIADAEERLADYRVEYTLKDEEATRLRNEVADLRAQLANKETNVQEEATAEATSN